MRVDVPSIQQSVATLLGQEPVWGPERVPGGRQAHARLSGEPRGYVESLGQVGPEVFLQRNSAHRLQLLRLVSLECAAGAPAERCKAWFRCIAQVASLPVTPGGAPADPVDAVTYLALTGEFPITFPGWPDAPDTEQLEDRVLYGLMTGRRLGFGASPELFDNPHWLELDDALQRHDAARARAAFTGIADWWLQEYEDLGQRELDLARFPLFEPGPNAALALATRRERLDIRFDAEKYTRFYVAGLL